MDELQGREKDYKDEIMSGPAQAWHLFKLVRGEGKNGHDNRIYLLPSQLCQVEEYRREEDRIRARMDNAKKLLETLGPDIDKAIMAFSGAMSL
jgi:hypothetical protein